MSAATTPTTQKAAKRHRCDWCWQFIEVGETYTRYRCFSQGDSGTVRMHSECMEAMQEEAAHEGGWIEWMPGQERPEKKVELKSAEVVK